MKTQYYWTVVVLGMTLAGCATQSPVAFKGYPTSFMTTYKDADGKQQSGRLTRIPSSVTDRLATTGLDSLRIEDNWGRLAFGQISQSQKVIDNPDKRIKSFIAITGNYWAKGSDDFLRYSDNLYFDKTSTVKSFQEVETKSGKTYRDLDGKTVSCDSQQDNLLFDAAYLEVHGMAHNAGDIVIYLPGKPMEGVQLLVGGTLLSDSLGNRAIGSIACVNQKGQCVFRGYATYCERVDKCSINNKLVFSTPVSIDQILQSRMDINKSLDSEALLRPSVSGTLEFVMERNGDCIAIPNRMATPIGIGSKMRFCANQWVDFLGVKYRNGGFKVTEEGLQIDEGTEKNDGEKVFKHQGSQWIPIETN